MSPSTLASEVQQALDGSLDKDAILLHVREYLAEEIAKQPLFGGCLGEAVHVLGEFDMWWKSLPKEMRIAKQDAVKAYQQAGKALPPIATLIELTAKQAEIRRRTGQAFPYPAKFLRQRLWENDLDAMRAWGGKKNGSLFEFSEDERQALDKDSRFELGSP